MAILYLDTSALVKLYVQELGTEEMLALSHPDSGHQLVLLALTRIEFRAAVFRRSKLGDIDIGQAKALALSLDNHFSSIFQVQPVNDAVLEEAAGIIDRHTLRAYDALQLGGCLALRATMATLDLNFVCADQELLAAATAEGMKTIDPRPSAQP